MDLDPNEDLNVYVVSGPFMQTGSVTATPLTRMIESIKSKNPHVVFIVRNFQNLSSYKLNFKHSPENLARAVD